MSHRLFNHLISNDSDFCHMTSWCYHRSEYCCLRLENCLNSGYYFIIKDLKVVISFIPLCYSHFSTIELNLIN